MQVDDKKFSVSINMYFGIKWNESRLNIEVSKSIKFRKFLDVFSEPRI